MNPYNNYRDFGIPVAASVTYTYVGSGMAADDNIATATYYNEQGTILGVLTFTYLNSTNNVGTIARTS